MRTVAIFAIFAFFCSLAPVPTLAAGGQFGNLSGNVADAVSKAPIAGAAVTAVSPSGRYNTTTDARGDFSILSMVVDTYTVTVTKQGYETLTLPGQTLQGDQTTAIGQWLLNRATPKTIAHVSSRSSGGAFQPSSTIDSYTVTPAQQLQTTGKAFSSNENNLLLAVPGVTITNAGNPTIRGGAAYEVGYQYDGVTFKEPFLGNNGSMGVNGNLFNGVAQVQVVAGAGDATQGGVGSGVINVIPERGSGPGTFNIDLEVGGPNYNHQFGATYSWASADGMFSDYAAFLGQRYTPYNGYSNTPRNQYGTWFGVWTAQNNQFTNNFVFKFGHNQNQSFQMLYTNILNQGFGPNSQGGIYCNPSEPNTPNGGPCPSNTNQNALAYYPYDTLTQFGFQQDLGFNILANGKPDGNLSAQTVYQHLIALTPGVPAVNQPVPGAQLLNTTTTEYLKFEYDYHINPSTYFDAKYYNWHDDSTSDTSYTFGAWGGGFPGFGQIVNDVGGPTYGISSDLQHQFGSNVIVTLNGTYNILRPLWYGNSPGYTMFGMFGTGLASQPTVQDWLPGGYLCGGGGANFNCKAGYSNVRMPMGFAGYNGSFFQNWGAGVRIQWSPTDKLHLDLGFRDEGQNQHWQSQLDLVGQAPTVGYNIQGCKAYNGSLASIYKCPAASVNPFDVAGFAWQSQFLYPHVGQPRTSIDWEIDRDDSLRFSYGRSAIFADAQTGGVPYHGYGFEPYWHIPAKPGATCGWTATLVFPCKSFGEQLYWQGDNVQAPDAGNTLPAIYSNFDFSWNHLFKSGYGLRLTPFSKIGTSLPTYYLINPVLSIFATSNKGYNKTNGLEFQLTTPSKQQGISGFLSVTYQNVLSTTPPFTFAETSVPIVSTATLALGNLYRAGYVSPLSARIGADDKLGNGFEIIPQIQFDEGYPYSQGNLYAAQIGNTYANVPQVNFGPGITTGNTTLIGTNPGTSTSTNFFDPSYPGTTFKPNIDATRGTPATAANGGFLSHGNIYGSTTVQWTHGNYTVGVQMQNLFGNAYVNSVPAVNPYYQAVANGLNGPQTGWNGCYQQVANARGCYQWIPRDTYAFTNGAYLLTNGNFTGGPVFAPLVPFNVDAFLQVKI